MLSIKEQVKELQNKAPALNKHCEYNNEILRLLWEVCKNYGAAGEVIWLVFKTKLTACDLSQDSNY